MRDERERSFGRRKIDPAKAVFAVAAVFLVFLAGGTFATMKWQPWQFIEDGARTAREFYLERTQSRPEILQPLRYEGRGVTVHEPGASPGLTAVQGRFAEGAELRLLDLDGKVVHRWQADFHALWPNPDHVFPLSNMPAGKFNYETHGMVFLPDGSVVFNFDNLGTVKLDKCGAVQWKLARATHHSVTANPDGTFWIPARVDMRKVEDAVLLKPLRKAEVLKMDGRYEDSLLLVGPDGRVLREFSVLKALFNGQFAPELFDVREFSFDDPTHLNDIDVVTPELAARIEGVEAGDLLVSFRQMHMLAILDRESGEILWNHVGPWVRQHDPDITPDGEIEVLSNGDERLAVDGVIGSSIVVLDPATGKARTVYPLDGQASFYTYIMGAQQRLPNGNRLITESMAGRIFEVDPNGRTVWEYVQAYDDAYAALLESAIRYDPGYFQVADWSCPGTG